jgi:Tol biopolymer transport system component
LAVVGDDAIVVSRRTAGPYETASHLVELTLSTGASRVLTSGETVADSGPVAVPTRQSVVFTWGVVDEQAATIGVLDLTTNAITWLTDESRLSGQPSVSRDGSTVVFDAFTPHGGDRATWAVSILGGEATLVDEIGNGHPVVVGSSVLLQSDGVFRAVPLP